MEYYNWVIKHEEPEEQWANVEKAVREQVPGFDDGDADDDVLGEGDASGEHGDGDGKDKDKAKVEEQVKGKDTSKDKDPETEEDWVRLIKAVIKYAREHQHA